MMRQRLKIDLVMAYLGDLIVAWLEDDEG
jgi:hypothetical protein